MLIGNYFLMIDTVLLFTKAKKTYTVPSRIGRLSAELLLFACFRKPPEICLGNLDAERSQQIADKNCCLLLYICLY
jgi:hypothetical protein